MTWNTPTASLEGSNSNTVGQRVKKYQTSGTVAKGGKKSMIRGLQMCAFLWWFMEPSEGMQGNPVPLSLLGQPC